MTVTPAPGLPVRRHDRPRRPRERTRYARTVNPLAAAVRRFDLGVLLVGATLALALAMAAYQVAVHG